MSREVNVRIEVRSGVSMWMGQGRNLPEALMGVAGFIPGPDDPCSSPEAASEVVGALRAIAPVQIAFRMDVRSLSRWWNPFTWGTVEVLIRSCPP